MGAQRKPRLWKPEEDRVLIQMLGDGMRHADIAMALNRPMTSIKSRIETLEITVPKKRGEKAPLVVKRPLRQERKCLCCPKTFYSDGPHHRMCDRCRAKAANDSNPFCN